MNAPYPFTTRARLLGLLLGLGLAWLTLGGARTQAGAATAVDRRPPNVVFILADDLGIRDLACYGRSDHTTPHLDRLAAAGLRFTSAYCAQPICSASRAAILTGQSPARLRLTTFLPGRPDARSQRLLHPTIEPRLPSTAPTLAERLAPAGYVSACIGKWHLGDGPADPGRRGFTTVYAGRANTTPSAAEGGKGEFDLTHQAIAFMEQNRDRPFFLYLAHNSPHIPYSAPPDRVAHHANAFEPVYAGLIETLDASVGELLAALDRLQLTEQTLVIFTSDNGGLHVPELRHARITHNGTFRAGKGYLYEGGLRIPLLVRWPGHTPTGRVVDDPVINTDWLPTLLELAGLPSPAALDGRSLAGLLRGTQPAPRRPFFWHFPHYTNQGGRPAGAVRQGRWKLIETYDDSSPELFDLEADPAETRNLAATHPRRVARLRRDLAAWRVAVGAQTNAPNPQVDESQFRRLYIDFDPSRFDPVHATPADWEAAARWRSAMDAAVTPRP